MSIHRQIVIVASLVCVVAMLVAIEYVAESLLNIRLFRPNINRFNVSGVVVDDRTGEPIPRARIVIMTWWTGPKGMQHCYGLEADEKGRFNVDRQSPHPLINAISVLASSPTNEYGVLGSSATVLEGDSIVAEDLVLRVSELPQIDAKKRRYRYETFCPGCNISNFEFLDEGWTPEYHGTID